MRLSKHRADPQPYDRPVPPTLRIASLIFAALGCAAGTLVAAAAFLPAQGELTQFPLTGSIWDTKPGQGALLIAAGIGLTIGALMTLETRQGLWAMLGLAAAVAAGLSLDIVTYHYVDPAIERSQSLWEMRGDGAVVAAVAAAAGALASLGAAGLAFSQVGRR